MSKTLEQIRTELDAKIPRDAVKTRQGSGQTFSYLEGHYVIDRLNKVLGQGNWSFNIENTQNVFTGKLTDRYNQETNGTSYIVTVRLRASIAGAICEFTDVGFGTATNKNDPGAVHELAVKGAVTDGLKRCAKNLGMSMGLALYDKTQENVQDDEPEVATGTATATTGNSKTVQATAQASSSEIKAAIKAAAQVLNAKKVMSIAVFRDTYLKPVGVAKTDELNDDQAQQVYTKLRAEQRELQLN